MGGRSSGARSLEASHGELAERVRTEADYFEKNAQRMRYPEFRQQGLLVARALSKPDAKR
jgi:hypothetical protein